MASAAPSGDLKTALDHAAQLLEQQPALAAEQAREILKVMPNTPSAQHILGVSYRKMGHTEKALETLSPLYKLHPNNPSLLHELGMVYSSLGQNDQALTTLEKAIELNPKMTDAWRTLAEQYHVAGREHESQKAYEAHLQASVSHPDAVKAAQKYTDGKLKEAEQLSRKVLKEDPTDVSAIRILADVGLKVGRLEDAQNLLERCLELAPGFKVARHSYANVLMRRQLLEEALDETAKLLKFEPENPNFQLLKGSILVRKGDHTPALVIYEKLITKYPKHPGAYMNYGHTLKTVGRVDDSVTAYRKCIELSHSVGEAYWSLANLKTFRFTDADILDIIARVTEEGGGDPEDQSHLAFSLGKAYEDNKDFNKSFKYYKRGNAIRKISHPYNPKANIYDSIRQIKTFDAGFLKERRGVGHAAPDPIFVVGLPRAGSTLIEQILASHSKVEGTSELADIIGISRKLGGKSKDNPASNYPEILTELSHEKFKALGEGYIETTQIQRHGTPYFIDKMPNNFLHIGLIHLILPNAKIIDARRHPMAGCFAGFKQLFARGQTFTYDLEDVGYYYRDYVKVMDHWDEVLPGRVHRVHYEDMITDTENQIRMLLDYCGLDFEESCLKFYETKRAVRTPSAEQVRQPIYTQGLEQWRNYEPYLGPLKDALGPLLERYPIK